MANDFSSESNLVLHVTFGGSDPLADQSGNGNHLYDQGLPVLDTVNMYEGDGCADFESGDDVHFNVADSDLTSTFPCKSGQSNTTFSASGWFKPETVQHCMLLGKYDVSADKRCFAICVQGATSKVRILWGYNNGASVYQYEINRTISSGTWYFIKATWNDAANSCTGYLYDSSNTTWYSISGAPADALNSEDSGFWIGNIEYTGNTYDGLIDDVCIFTDIVSDAEAESMVAGTYDYDGDANLLSRYQFNKTGLGYDSKGNNHIRSVPIPGFAGPRADIKACLFDGDYTCHLQRADADLSADFPAKNGTSNTTMTLCGWFKLTTVHSYDHPVSKLVAVTLDGWDTMLWIDGSHLIGGRWDPEALYTSRAASTGVWYHYSLVVDNANDRMYVRVYDSSNSTAYTAEDTGATGSFIVNNQPLRVGACITNDHPYDGYIGELVIFDRALTNQELVDIQNGVFGVLPSKAINPDPADGAVDVLRDDDLSWDNGGGATSYDVYLGETVGSMVLVSSSQAGTSYDPGTMNYGTTYYWRIDSIGTYGTTTGDVWDFTTEDAPELPSAPVVPVSGRRWPHLTVWPERDSYDEKPVEDVTIRSLSGDGRVITRRASKRLLREFTFVLRHLSSEEKETLEQFQDDMRVGGRIIFWTDVRPTSTGRRVLRGVRLVVPLLFDLDDEGSAYRTEVVFQEDPEHAGKLTGGTELEDMIYPVENLAAGADIANRLIYSPCADIDLTTVKILVTGTPAGIDNANTVVLELKNSNGNTILTKTYNTATQPPTNGMDDLSADIDVDYSQITTEDYVTLSVTQGVTANMPDFVLILGGDLL